MTYDSGSAGGFAVSNAMTRAAKRMVRSCVRLIPGWLGRTTLQRAALASPAMKTATFERICCALARTLFPQSKEIWMTNLGVSPDLRCQIPLAKGSYIFGRPENALSERATLALATELCRDCTDFVDIGANDGIFIFAINRKSNHDLRLHWFEPDQTLHDRLQANLAANSIVAVGNRAAVAAKRGTARFLKNLTDDSSGSLTDSFASKHETIVVEVDTICLNEHFRDHRIADAIVKVDVEGAGNEVWRGARDVASHIRYLIMEIIGPETQCRLPSKVISEGKFHAYYIKDFDLTVSRDGASQYLAPFWNWLFCRLDPEALRARLAGTQFRVIECAS